MDTTGLISRLQLAAELGVTPQTIRAWERAGWFPPPKRYLSPRVILYAVSEVKQAIAARAIRSRESA